MIVFIQIFKPCNIDQTLQLTLSILCTSNDVSTVTHAVDIVLLLLLSLQEFQDAIAQLVHNYMSLKLYTYCYRYCQFKDCLQKAFRRLAEVNGQVAAKVI